jgi:hypothetical protein
MVGVPNTPCRPPLQSLQWRHLPGLQACCEGVMVLWPLATPIMGWFFLKSALLIMA